MNDDELSLVFRKAAEKALAVWLPEQWDRQSYEADDLAQDLWQWYLERPSTRRKMEALSKSEAVETAYIHAMQILSGQVRAANTFNGRDLYSADCVREALRGESTNDYLNEILPHALETLQSRNQTQAEAIRSRYDRAEVPQTPATERVLSRAVKSLTELANRTYLTSDSECIGSRASVFPETRKPKGRHSDPTGNTVVLLDENPEFRYHFLQETPMYQYLGGAAVQPVLDLGAVGGKTVRYRRAG